MTTTVSTANLTEQKSTDPSKFRQMLNKVPEVTLYFWIIKILCTTVGETFADYLNTNLNLGLTNTTYVIGTLLLVVLFFQFKAKKYIPGMYWIAVVLISVVGTLITDNLTDGFGISLKITTVVFSVLLAVVFAAWYAIEKTLSVHSIVTTKREAFYWLTILFTFALGTASGDLIAEQFSVGYLNSVLLFAGCIALVTGVYYLVKRRLAVKHQLQSAYAILAFWLAYVLTRPLGASIGDYMSQSHDDGGLALGTTVTSGIFLAAILCLVVYLSVTKKDQIKTEKLV